MIATLEQVGLHPAEGLSRQYPHQLSGGQRQRVVIAGAMVLDPHLVIADEPVSMLDVSLRAGILRLMLRLRDERGVSFIFVTHDLSLAWVIAERIAVLYLGRVVEIGRDRDDPRRRPAPLHPGARGGDPGARTTRTQTGRLLTGEAPSASRIPAGCRFRPRCPLYRELGEPASCRDEDPVLKDVSGAQGAARHEVACHFVDRR